jgi:lysophospholipase-2
MEFPEPHIQLPQGPHTHTAILLHGRGSNGHEFAEELFSSMTSKNQTLADRLPSWRWVFPTSRDRWSTRFQEEMCAWFDAYSLDDIQERQELQIDGLRESVSHILDILEYEISLLGGKPSHVFLGGISQGMATVLWTFFGAIATGRIQEPLGGLLGFCGWLPFARQVEDLVQQPTLSGPREPQMRRLVSEVFLDTIAGHEGSRMTQSLDTSVLSTPVFLSHGTDDAWVSVELGRQASRILQQIMVHVEWNEFTGAEGDGHWIKEPEGFDQILRFLEDGIARTHVRVDH